MLEWSQLGQAHADAARQLAEEIVRGQISFILEPGGYLIVNQRRYLHGREALQDGQEKIAAPGRRLFLRAPADASLAA
ncbi:hypothetical protein ACFQ9Q_41540 [Streptomyces virginiae]|uniref:hypothetical protein n=1 Tax=Streptomyces virginiae TaxID=1961 RepID=UPI0036779826